MGGLELLHCLAEVGTGCPIKPTAERQFRDRDTGFSESCRADGMTADQDGLRNARLLKGHNEAFKKRFSPAMVGPGHGLQQAYC
jgi:hypothetical protein